MLERHKTQDGKLVAFIKRYATETGFLAPDNLLTQCLHLVALVQPLVFAKEKFAANFHYIAQGKTEGRLSEVFLGVCRDLFSVMR